MATFAVQPLADLTETDPGLEPTNNAVSPAGDEFANDGNTRLHFIAGSAAAGTTRVVIASQVECNQGFTHNLVVSVDSGDNEIVRPLPRNRFNDGDGNVQLTYYSDAALATALTSAQAAAFTVALLSG